MPKGKKTFPPELVPVPWGSSRGWGRSHAIHSFRTGGNPKASAATRAI